MLNHFEAKKIDSKMTEKTQFLFDRNYFSWFKDSNWNWYQALPFSSYPSKHPIQTTFFSFKKILRSTLWPGMCKLTKCWNNQKISGQLVEKKDCSWLARRLDFGKKNISMKIYKNFKNCWYLFGGNLNKYIENFKSHLKLPWENGSLV